MTSRELIECIAHLDMTGRIRWPRRGSAPAAPLHGSRPPARPHEQPGGVSLDPRQGRAAILAAIAAAGIARRSPPKP